VARADAHLHAKFHLDPSNRLATIHQRYRQTGQDRQRSDSIGRTVLQTVAPKKDEMIQAKNDNQSHMDPEIASDHMVKIVKLFVSETHAARNIHCWLQHDKWSYSYKNAANTYK